MPYPTANLVFTGHIYKSIDTQTTLMNLLSTTVSARESLPTASQLGPGCAGVGPMPVENHPGSFTIRNSPIHREPVQYTSTSVPNYEAVQRRGTKCFLVAIRLAHWARRKA